MEEPEGASARRYLRERGYDGEIPLHSDFRVIGTQNTEGRGDDQGLYHGGVEDVFAWDCQIGQVSTQDNVLEIKANGNRGGEVHNIYIRDIEAKNLKWVMTVNHNYSPRSFASDGPQNLPRAHHIYIENVTVQNGGFNVTVGGREWRP